MNPTSRVWREMSQVRTLRLAAASPRSEGTPWGSREVAAGRKPGPHFSDGNTADKRIGGA